MAAYSKSNTFQFKHFDMYKTLILPITENSEEFVKFFCCIHIYFSYNNLVNIYEVNVIFSEYLRVWFKSNSSENYVTFDNLCKSYRLRICPLLEKYFSIYSIIIVLLILDNCVYYEPFLQFILIFSITNGSHLIPSLLSVVSIHVTTYINPIELQRFYELIDPRQKYRDELDRWIVENTDSLDGSIPLPNVYKFFSSRPVIIGSILSIRRKIVAGVLGKDTVKTITYRYKHIELIRKFKREHKGKNKPESCKSRIHRLIHGGPQPYHYDFEPSDYVNIDSVTALFRMKYGFKPPTESLPFCYKNGAIYKTSINHNNNNSDNKNNFRFNYNRNRIIRPTGDFSIRGPRQFKKTKQLGELHKEPSFNLNNLENEIDDEDAEPPIVMERMKLPMIKSSTIKPSVLSGTTHPSIPPPHSHY